MRSSTRQAIACIFAIFSVAITANAQSTPIKEPGATISGKVTIKGQAAPGVIVTLRQNDRAYGGREYSGPKGVSDNDGNYRIENVPPGSYRISLAARAYVLAEGSERERLLIVNKGDTIEHIDFAMIRGAVITGKVIDAEGRPIVEEWVSVFTPDNRTVNVLNNSMTDDRGFYRIYGLPAGRYRVAAGRGEDSFSGGLPRPYRRTYHPSVSDPAQATVVEVGEGSELKDVDIMFTRTVSTYTARGRIVDGETGQPLANVDYGITRYEERGSSSRSGGYVTNSRGEFKLENLAPGKYSIPISNSRENDLRFEETQFEIVDHDVNDLVIKATKGGSISGVVVFEGVDQKTREQFGRSWIGVSIEGAPQRSTGSNAEVREDGSFNIRGIAGGTATFYLFGRGESIRVDRVERDGVIQPRGLVIKDREHVTGVRVTVQYGNASLRGKIEVENGTLPADGYFYVWAKLLGTDASVRFSGSNMRPQVDARGQFVIEGLTAGTYEIEAGVYVVSSKLRYAAKNQQVVVTAGSSNTVNITVDLTSTPTKIQ
ncbi:MAG TPA: carboxypeptidase regulatory-like domain-containing protein [Pyrinomonadaceae bacterium]|nr:carboxypeptidase regulatory-like domain-containing protein [Pyrinomonadaceae bacterium]